MSNATGLFKIVFNNYTLLESPLNHGRKQGPISEALYANAAVLREIRISDSSILWLKATSNLQNADYAMPSQEAARPKSQSNMQF